MTREEVHPVRQQAEVLRDRLRTLEKAHVLDSIQTTVRNVYAARRIIEQVIDLLCEAEALTP